MVITEPTVADACTGLPLYLPPDLTGTILTIRAQPVAYHGNDPADAEFVYPGRRVIDVAGHTWLAARPEECAGPLLMWLDRHGNAWLPAYPSPDAVVLVCLRCGLDCT